MRKFIILLLVSLLTLPFINNNVNAAINDFNRSIVVQDDSLNPTGSNNSIDNLNSGRFLDINSSDVLVYDVGITSFNASYTYYPLINGHEYYVYIKLTDASVGGFAGTGFYVIYADDNNDGYILDVDSDTIKEGIFTATQTDNANLRTVTGSNGLMQYEDVVFIDLTSYFGSGNEPTYSELKAAGYPDEFGYINIVDNSPSIGLLDVNRSVDEVYSDSGIELEQILTNGNFDSGVISPFAGSGVGVPIVLNGVVSFTSTIQNGSFSYDTPTGILNGTLIYYAAYIKATSSSIALSMSGVSSLYHSGSGNWELISGFMTPAGDNYKPRVTDLRAGSWDVVQVMDFVVIPVPDGVETVEEMELLLENRPYFEGSNGESNNVGTTSGKNLFKNTNVTNGRLIIADGTVSPVTTYLHFNNKIDVVAGETYTIKINETAIGATTWRFDDYVYYNDDIFVSGFNTGVDTELTITIPVGVNQFDINIKKLDSSVIEESEVYNADIQIELGSTATAYEPYEQDNSIKLYGSGYDIDSIADTEFIEYWGDVYDIDQPIWDGLTLRNIFGDSLYGTGKTNLIDNGDFTLDTNFDGLADNFLKEGSIASLSSGIQTITYNNVDAFYNIRNATLTLPLSNYYLSFEIVDINGSNIQPQYRNNITYTSLGSSISSNGNYSYLINDIYWSTRLLIQPANIGDYFSVDNYMVYDFDGLFNGVTEPTIEEFEYLLEAYKELEVEGESSSVYLRSSPVVRPVAYQYIKHITEYSDSPFLYNFTDVYSKGNEPTDVEFEVILTANSLTTNDTIDYVGSTYFEMVSNTNFYQYDDTANLYFTLTETLLHNLTEPIVVINKKDLDGVLIGNLFTGLMSYDGTDDGFNVYALDYNLPATVMGEDGYIFEVVNGTTGILLETGYVYDNFTQVGDLFFNDTAYNGYENDNPEEYIFNNINLGVFHYAVDNTKMANEDYNINLYYEDMLDNKTVNLGQIVKGFSYDLTALHRGFIIVSPDQTKPYLINHINTTTVFNPNFATMVSTYELYCDEFLDLLLYNDTKGLWTYNLYDGASWLEQGYSPIYYTDVVTLYDLSLLNDTIKMGNFVNVVYNKYDVLIDDEYTVQNIYDFNNNRTIDVSGVYSQSNTFKILTDEGLSTGSSYVELYLANTGNYDNGANFDDYNITLRSNYTLRFPNTPSDTIENGLDFLGLNNSRGKIIFVMAVLLAASIILALFRAGLVPIMLINFILIAFFTIIGILPVVVVLIIIMIAVIGVFLFANRS